MIDGRVDLHIHSSWSGDADFSPAELVRMAGEAGLRAISIADHDTVRAYPRAVELGRRAGVEVIPSLELTTQFDGREFHLLLPFVDTESPGLRDVLDRSRLVRLREGEERVEKLRALGIPVSFEEVMAEAAKKGEDVLPLGVFIAGVVLDKPEVRAAPRFRKYYSAGEAEPPPFLFYRDYFEEGRPAYAPKRYINLLEVLALAPQTGGLPVLAHPGARFVRAEERDLEILKEAGLRGLEVYTTYHRPPVCAHRGLEDKYLALAERLGLVPTAGSDFHGRIKSFITFGALAEGRYWMIEKLRNGRTKP